MRAVSIVFATVMSGCVFLLPAQEPPLLPPPTQGSANRLEQKTGMEQELLSKMHQLNQMEIDIGKLAEQKAESPKVKRYADRLVKDHDMGDRKVEGLAKQLNVTLVKPEPKTPEEQQKMQMQMQTMEKLKGMSGKEFDAAFLEAMVQGHNHALEMLRGAEGKLPASPLKKLVSGMAPILQQHHDLAADLQKEGQ